MQRRQQGTARGGRASVKSQRRVNTQQTRNATKKKPQQQKENASKQQHAAPVGVSGVPLAARFSSLQKEALAHHKGPATKSKKSNVVVNIKKPGQQVAKKAVKQQQKTQQQQKAQQQKQKLQQVTQANRTKRQATVNQRRKGLEVAPPATKAGKKNKSNGANGAAVAGKPKKKMGAKATDDKKKKPVTGEDLDVEMDEYWHEAGKGPDPKQAQLDRQMEEYWAGKPKRDGDDVTASETPSA